MSQSSRWPAGAAPLIVVVDLRGRLQHASPSFEELCGRQLVDVRGCDWLTTFVPDAARAQEQAHLAEILGGAVLGVRASAIVGPSGRERAVEWDDQLLRDADGQVSGVLRAGCACASSASDADVERRVDERFRVLFEQAAIGVAELESASGRIVRVNRKYTEIVGYTGDELAKLDFLVITHPDDLAADLANMERLQAGEIREFSMEKRLLRRDGSSVWVNLSVSPVSITGERFTHHIAVIEDISERKHAEAQRRELDAQLHRAHRVEAIGTLAAGIAHDFNNILAAIMASAGLAKLDVDSASRASRCLDEILRAGTRGADLLRRLLSVGRRRSDRPVLVSLPDVVGDSVQLLRASLPEQVELEVWCDDDTPQVLSDPTELGQVLLNLGTNAWQALGGRAGRIEIRTASVVLDDVRVVTALPPGPYACVTVTDSGAGMDDATMARIFDPFFTTKEVGQGTGLGLAIVHSIMMANGGAVSVASSPGDGAKFELYFPAASGAGRPERPRAPSSTPPLDGRLGDGLGERLGDDELESTAAGAPSSTE